MVKRYIFQFLLLATTLTGCQHEADIIESLPVSERFETTMEAFDVDTKTGLSGSGERQYAVWTKNDAISVFQGRSVADRYTLQDNSESAFRLSERADAEGDVIGGIVAMYPHYADASCRQTDKGYEVSGVHFPSDQEYAVNSFAEESFVMIAATADLSSRTLDFKNVCGGVRILLKSDAADEVFVTGLTLESNSGEALSGTGIISYASAKSAPSVSWSDNQSEKITLTCPSSGVQLNSQTATEFIFALPPVELPEGFTLTINAIVNGEASTYSRPTVRLQTIRRSRILTMPEIVYDEFFENPDQGPQEGDYVDEYGINHGQGVEIDGVVWAPVNCGYHDADFKYGKLYQWGRRYGQGYNGYLNDLNQNNLGRYSDAVTPVIKEGPVDLQTGQSKDNEKTFYRNLATPRNWLYPFDDALWNAGSDDNPVKTEYDPCPSGWRVPTYKELSGLSRNISSWTTGPDGYAGYWLSGSESVASADSKVFLSAAGYYSYSGGDAVFRGAYAGYWSSRSMHYNYEDVANALYFSKNTPDIYNLSCAYGFSIRCVKDDSEVVDVKSLVLSPSYISMKAGEKYTISYTISPSAANYQTVYWWSEDETVAKVDSRGNVTAIAAGTTTINAMAGMQIATCTVAVSAPATPQERDYIDDYGINHGPGVKIGETIWAPVNCGYHETDFKYGKLYQWGRRYGHDSKEYNEFDLVIKSGPVSLFTGQNKDNADVFYTGEDHPYDWCNTQLDDLWNLATEEDPLKTEYDPCPSGWRVPTYTEMETLLGNYSEWMSNSLGQNGFWFSGDVVYDDNLPRVFLPAAGNLGYNDGRIYKREYIGGYYTSSLSFDSYVCQPGFASHGAYTINSQRAGAASVRCVLDDAELVPVVSLTLSASEVSMEIGETYMISHAIYPSDANHKAAYLWSDNDGIASVDADGRITAISAGTATITAMAGMQVATCVVTVSVTAHPQMSDYIDEYGVNHGQGVKIGETVWAPVNCGYHATDFKYGKLYQWGRKYGQGYNGTLYDVSGSKVGTYSDAVVPTIVSGPVDLATGQSKDNENIFYNNSSDPWDWLSPQDDELWNSGTEENPVKTEYDPCPVGWRVPTYAELSELIQNKSSWTADESGQPGYWFSGASSYTENVPQVFFPAAGGRGYGGGNANTRGYSGCYWSSRTYYNGASFLYFSSGNDYMGSGYGRATGRSVRCVQITD